MAIDGRKVERMKADYSSARPPQWAESLLRLLLRPEDRESVSGDLLEEYRETRLPAIGRAADAWYVRQVGSFLWRASWRWGALLGATLVIRYLFDTLAPPADYWLRATIVSYIILGACALAGCTAAWRTHSFRAGVLTSVGAATIGALLSIGGTTVMLVIWHDPAMLDAWRNSGGLQEAFIDVPLKLLALGLAIGAAGAVIGKSAAKTLAGTATAA